MRLVGFSTGALAYSDFRRGVALLRGQKMRAVELSALRQQELQPLVEGVADLDLSSFAYVSVHAPSAIRVNDERSVVELLAPLGGRGWPIILHPDAVHDFTLWRKLGDQICIENMDKRKPAGRTARELAAVFGRLPEAGFCFDIGHARQVDSTMTEAYLILRDFGSRLRQAHVSEVNTRSKHDRLSYASILAFQEVAQWIPEETPLILETPVGESEMGAEVRRVLEALPVPAGAGSAIMT
jgi:hypothetical protein